MTREWHDQNLLLRTDSYKLGHSRMLPQDADSMYYYLEARGGEFPSTVFYGLQYILDDLTNCLPIFPSDVEEAREFSKLHFGNDDYFDSTVWERVIDKHKGYLPIRIRAVPEGTVVPVGNVLMTVESLDSHFAFIPGFLETMLMKVWYPTTVATQSYHIKKSLKKVWAETGSSEASLDFAYHDFGYRGVSSEESAGLGASAHLLSFRGSDTLAGIRLASQTYDERMAGFSVAATEHSVTTAWWPEREAEFYAHMLDQYPTGIISIVSDSYDLENAVDNIFCVELRDKVLARSGVLVVRPDSGEPNEVVLSVLNSLWSAYGGTQTSTGFRLLDPHVRVIYGDGMNRETIPAIYSWIADNGYAAENLVVGSGGGTLQAVSRDTCRFAYKASEITYDSAGPFAICKNPKTDPTKASKAGRFKLIQTSSGLATVADNAQASTYTDILETVYDNGDFVNHAPTFSEIRERMTRG